MEQNMRQWLAERVTALEERVALLERKKPEPEVTAPEIERCALCGSAPIHKVRVTSLSAGYVQCSNMACYIFGPSRDPKGLKWNAMQRAIKRGGYNELECKPCP